MNKRVGVRPIGKVEYKQANFPPFRIRSNGGQVDVIVHKSTVFDGRFNRQQSAGGGLQYKHPSGVKGELDVTHAKGQGHTYSASVGIPMDPDSNGGQVNVNMHGSRVVGGPYNKQNTVGGGLQYKHPSRVKGELDVTHSKGQGNTYSASSGIPMDLEVGGSNGGQVDVNMHGSKVFGGTYNKHHTVGGGLQYKHPSGVTRGLNVTHSRGQGNTYSVSVKIPL